MSTKLPSAFLRSLIDNHHFEEEPFIKSHEDGEQLTSLRINPFKKHDLKITTQMVPWCKNGRYLAERPVFTADPVFHAGCYYVQEASSMFLEQVLQHASNLNEPLKVLDLCAAPGGKSTHIASLISPDSLLVSNEIIKTRVPVLADNLIKWGSANTFVSNNDSRDFKRLGAYFDVAVVDAPCSGSGMFRKDPDAINEWSESAVLLCSQRQQRILADVYPAIRENGVLIYSTCSYSKMENEDISDWLCDTFSMETVQIPLEKEWGIEETRSDKHQCYGYRFYPYKVKGEGFFIACFKKRESSPEPQMKRAKEVRINQKTEEVISKWIKNPENTRMMEHHDELFAIHKQHEADLQHLQSNLYLKKSGVRIGKMMGKDIVPSHELAMSLITNNGIPKINLSREEAITYLKRDDLKISSDQIGWVLMCFEDQPLGWAKMLGNRINNYFPKELRIVNRKIN